MDNSSNGSAYNIEDDLQRKATVMMNALNAILAQLKRIEVEQNSLQKQLCDVMRQLNNLSGKIDVITPDIYQY